MVDNGFEQDKVDTTLFVKRKDDDILLTQIYIDDIIFDPLISYFAKNLPISWKANLW